MKINLTEKKEQFKPFKLELVVETEQEAYVLLGLALTNDSVPEMVERHWGENLKVGRKDVKEVLEKLRDFLEKETNLKRRRDK
jgi:hypothetical protein